MSEKILRTSVATFLLLGSAFATSVNLDPATPISAEDVGKIPADPNMMGQDSSMPAGAVEDESSPKRKRVLDFVRKGVVVIDVKTYASTESEKRTAWSGSGFIIDKENGIIATNRHVAGDLTVSTYTIKFENGTTTEASLAYFDPLYDFAFLKVDPKKFPKDVVALELSKKPVGVNDSIYSMGNSGKDEFSTFKGTIFSVYENLGPFAEQSFKFSGLTIPGASGSPVFTDEGIVVGIVYGGKFSSGAALPIQYVTDALTSVKEKKLPQRRSIGIVPTYVSVEDVEKAGLLPEEAVKKYHAQFPDSNNKIPFINSRLMGTGAQKSFQAGDILWEVGGKLIGPNLYEFDRMINESGEKPLSMKVYRGGKLVDVSVSSYPLSLRYAQHMITFADATWVGNNEFVRFFLGFDGEGVFALGAGPTSPLRSVIGEGLPSFFVDTRILRITELDGHPLKNLDELIKVIPTLSGKKEFTLKYIDYQGMVGLGMFSSADRQERMAIVKYEGGFDAPKSYRFDLENFIWKAEDIKAPESKAEVKTDKGLLDKMMPKK